MEIVCTDVLIIGSGIAGLRAALEVSRRGKQAVVVSKSSAGKANNSYLAGGLFAVSHGDFSRDAHREKTLSSGRHLNKQCLVNKFVSEAPRMIEELQGFGLKGNFLLNGFATWDESLIGGPKISAVLVASCRKAGVRFLDGLMATDLLVRENACLGAFAFHRWTGHLYGIRAGAVLLATGGAGAIYSEHDNAPGMTGDGYVLALQASLELIDMEFIQFYPMAYASKGNPHMLIPAALADLGIIKNRFGEDLKKKYSLSEKPIAIVSRDRFAQALFKEMRLGNDVRGALLLDLRKMDNASMPESNALEARLRKSIAYDGKPIRIVPACHHTMGGLVIDPAGRTRIENLFAAGEVVGGIHGANRMGGNALSEALVFGAIGGRTAVERLTASKAQPDINTMVKECAGRSFHSKIDKRAKASVAPDLMKEIGDILWNCSGILRNGPSLKKALESIEEILKDITEQHAADPWELSKIIECENAAINAYAITASALKRTESRGSHYREDYPFESEDWKTHLYIKISEGLPRVSHLPGSAE